MATSYNIGIRHMLPAYPLLLSAAVLVLFRLSPARAAAAVARRSRRPSSSSRRCASTRTSSRSSTRPPGGPANGAAWLNDSNLDWGQDLDRLARRLEARGEEARATIAYFGGGDAPYYVPKATVFDPVDRTPFRPGLYAVSSFLLCCGPEAMAFHGDPRRRRRLRAAPPRAFRARNAGGTRGILHPPLRA